MRRLMSIAAFSFFLSLPLWAQHGGGHATFGGGHSGGFSGHILSGSHTGASHFSGGARSGFSGGSSRSARPGSSRTTFSQNRVHFRTGFRNRGFRNDCFNFGCRTGFSYPWLGYDPWFWDWNSDSSYNNGNDYNDNLAIAAETNRQNIEQQRMLRQEEADGDQDSYQPDVNSRLAPRSVDAQSTEALLPATILVFRDEHKQEIQNYAIVGQTLWNFAPGHTQKIPFSTLDLAATEKANDDRGVTFRVPTPTEAQ
jgi:hypothetical protein